MATIDNLRDALRIELHDEDEARWQDETLDRHLQRAARELAFVWPREQRSTLSTTPGSREVSLAALSGLIRVLAVEYPVSQYPPAYVGFSSFGETLSLAVSEAPGGIEDVGVFWGGLHSLDSLASTLPSAAEDAAITGAAAFAAIEWASFATNRSNVGGPEVATSYLRWGERQLARFHEMLSRFGDNGRVRTARMVAAGDNGSGRRRLRWEA